MWRYQKAGISGGERRRKKQEEGEKKGEVVKARIRKHAGWGRNKGGMTNEGRKE